MTAPSALIQALEQLKKIEKRCQFAKLLADTLTVEEKAAVEDTLTVKASAGRRSPVKWDEIALILAEEVGIPVKGYDVRRHAKRECTCE